MDPPPKRLRRLPLKGAPLAAWQSQIRGGRLAAAVHALRVAPGRAPWMGV
jgi:hypothetical protein